MNFLFKFKNYILDDRFLHFDDVIVLGFEGWPKLFFVEILVFRIEFNFSLLVLFAFKHLEIELILVFELGLLLEIF